MDAFLPQSFAGSENAPNAEKEASAPRFRLNENWWCGTDSAMPAPTGIVPIDHVHLIVTESGRRVQLGRRGSTRENLSGRQQALQRRTSGGALHLRANAALPPGAAFGYFEVTLADGGSPARSSNNDTSGDGEQSSGYGLVIGYVSGRLMRHSRLPGEETQTVGWFVSQGLVYRGNSDAEAASPLPKSSDLCVGDTVGCFLNVAKKEATFTRNGDVVGSPLSVELDPSAGIFPAIGVQSASTPRVYTVRFPGHDDETAADAGGFGFVFDADAHIAKLLDAELVVTEQSRLSSAMRAAQLVRQFFIARGMAAVLRAFDRERRTVGLQGGDSSAEDEESAVRLQAHLLELISDGNSSAALQVLARAKSPLLKQRLDIVFRLKVQSIIDSLATAVLRNRLGIEPKAPDMSVPVSPAHSLSASMESMQAASASAGDSTAQEAGSKGSSTSSPVTSDEGALVELCGNLLGQFHVLEERILAEESNGGARKSGAAAETSPLAMTHGSVREAVLYSLASCVTGNKPPTEKEWSQFVSASRRQCWNAVLDACETKGDVASLRSLERRCEAKARADRRFSLLRRRVANDRDKRLAATMNAPSGPSSSSKQDEAIGGGVPVDNARSNGPLPDDLETFLGRLEDSIVSLVVD